MYYSITNSLALNQIKLNNINLEIVVVFDFQHEKPKIIKIMDQSTPNLSTFCTMGTSNCIYEMKMIIADNKLKDPVIGKHSISLFNSNPDDEILFLPNGEDIMMIYLPADLVIKNVFEAITNVYEYPLNKPLPSAYFCECEIHIENQILKTIKRLY